MYVWVCTIYNATYLNTPSALWINELFDLKIQFPENAADLQSVKAATDNAAIFI